MKRHSLFRILKLAKPYYKHLLLAAACVIAVNMSQLAKPYILKIIIDDFLVGNKNQSGWHSINSFGLLYFFAVALGSILTFAQVNLMNYAGQQIIGKLRGDLFKHIQFLPLPSLDKYSSGRLITRATNDVEALNELFTEVLISLFKDLFLIIGIVYMMFSLNVVMAFIGLTVIPFIVIMTNFIKNRIKTNFVRMKSLIGRINGFFAENISGMKLVQIFHIEKEKAKEFNDLNDEYYKATRFQVRLNSFLNPVIEIFENLAISCLVFYSMNKILNNTLELGVLYAFTTYIKQFFQPISDLAENYNTIQSAIVSADRVFELLDENCNLEDLDKGIEVSELKGEVEFKNVWFSYNDKDWVLKDVSFKINPGEKVAFVGATGAGKTTIISLISRFYSVQKGEILIDGVNIKELQLKSLRRNISVILQDVFLFSGTIRKNISLNSDLSEEEISSALRSSYADEFVKELPGGIYEPVMERGNTLSLGQRQLLSFARAIAHKPAILVLDEATANIDTKTEQLIQKSIENVSKERTTLVIAHRLSTIRNSDKIIVLNSGRVVEIGDHSSLLNCDSYYKGLYEAQFAQ